MISEPNIKNIIDVLTQLKDIDEKKVERKAFLLMPTDGGFDSYMISEETAKMVIVAETLKLKCKDEHTR